MNHTTGDTCITIKLQTPEALQQLTFRATVPAFHRVAWLNEAKRDFFVVYKNIKRAKAT